MLTKYFIIFLVNISIVLTFEKMSARRKNTAKRNYHISFDYQTNWFRAFHYCKYYNMDLVTIENEDEKNQIKAKIESFQYLNKTFWTSATDLGVEGQFFWTTNGRPLQYKRWAVGEPSGKLGDHDHCVSITSESILFNDQDCDIDNYFICQSYHVRDDNNLRLIFV